MHYLIEMGVILKGQWSMVFKNHVDYGCITLSIINRDTCLIFFFYFEEKS